VPHAGETAGAESVWSAVRLGADRIGHGIRAIDDPSLVRELAARRIPLEVCITSNLATGAVASLAEHPALRLHRAGVPITLNTDDPAIFSTTLAREFAVAAELGFTRDELADVAANASRHALP
jgi:adenosine deaminase